MKRQSPRTFAVLSTRPVTPNMLRVTIGGEGLAGFPADQAGAYVKLLFPRQDARPAVRTLTVRAQHEDALDIDFTVHAGGGPAARWAQTTVAGDTILLGGPGPAKRVDPTADAVLEIAHPDDAEALAHPAGIMLHWLVNPEPGHAPTLLRDAVRQLPVPEGRVAYWAACELSAMRNLRELLRVERAVDPADLYVSSYWKLGVSEEQHKQLKRDDAEGFASHA